MSLVCVCGWLRTSDNLQIYHDLDISTQIDHLFPILYDLAYVAGCEPCQLHGQRSTCFSGLDDL